MTNTTAELYYDGIGIVNNRGYSKYWGVSPHPNFNNRWRVCLNHGGTNFTFLFDRDIIESEVLAAKIAAHLYQFRNAERLPHFIYVKVDGNTYRLDFDYCLITREAPSIVDRITPLDIENLSIWKSKAVDDEEEIDVPTFSFEKYGLSDFEKTLIEDVFDALISDMVSKRGKVVLKKVVDILS